MTEKFALTVNGQSVESTAGCSVAAAVMNAQGPALRQSVTGEMRSPLCGMGVCFECRLTIDGVPHQRSCQTLCQEGMRVEAGPSPSVSEVLIDSIGRRSDLEFDVLVIGSGPAGIAAACCAAEAGKRIGIVDDNPQPGGQIWRHDSGKSIADHPNAWIERLRRLPIEILALTEIFGSLGPTTLLAKAPRGVLALRAQRMILACGARERFLPFPGWTLPGVFGAGGLQALVKSGWPIANRKIVVAGSGPLLLAVAAFLRQRGADVRRIAEQTPRGKLLRFGGALLLRQPGKIAEAFGFGWRLRGIPYRTGCWPIRVEGAGRVESVTLTDGASNWTEPCDALACGFGLVSNLELPMLLGCAIKDGFVLADEHQRTSIPGIYAIGELTGIGGLDKAILEGQIAGHVAADRVDQAVRLLRGHDSADRFVRLLHDTFALRDELRQLPGDDTIVCRCEDVSFGRLRQHANWRDAKLQTRCGMGPCQGRICGPAVQFLLGWGNESVRPPILPTALGNLGFKKDS